MCVCVYVLFARALQLSLYNTNHQPSFISPFTIDVSFRRTRETHYHADTRHHYRSARADDDSATRGRGAGGRARACSRRQHAFFYLEENKFWPNSIASRCRRRVVKIRASALTQKRR